MGMEQMLGPMIKMITGGGNPEQIVTGLLQNMGGSNIPMIGNIMQCVQRKDANGLQEIAANICKEKGLDFNEAFNSFRNQ